VQVTSGNPTTYFPLAIMSYKALSSLLFNFALECAFRRVQTNQVGFKLISTRRLLICAHSVHIVGGGSIQATRRKTGAFVAASKGFI